MSMGDDVTTALCRVLEKWVNSVLRRLKPLRNGLPRSASAEPLLCGRLGSGGGGNRTGVDGLLCSCTGDCQENRP